MSESPDDDRTVSSPGPDAGVGARGPHSGSRSGNALPAGTRIAEFEVRGVLGEGGFSIVYQAWDHTLHRYVALKEYVPAAFARRDSALRVCARSAKDHEMFDMGLKSFIEEARLLAGFNHPSLVKVHRFWEERGTAFMAMPWYQGLTLKQALASMRAPPSQQWVMRLLQPLTEALGVMHAQRCYHRDIAPDNIILAGSNQEPVLLDLGAARKVVESATQDLTTILKVGYSPVEQYGQIPGVRQGPWTDVYALAAVVHYAIRGSTPPPAVARVVDDTYVPLGRSHVASYSKSFLGAIDDALAVLPRDRTPSIERFRTALGLDGTRHDDSATGRPALRRAMVLGAGGFAAVAVATGGWLWSGRHESVQGQTMAAASAPVTVGTGALASTRASPGAAANGHVDGGSDDMLRRRVVESSQRLTRVVADLRQLSTTEKKDIDALSRWLDQATLNAQAAERAGRLDDAIVINTEGAVRAEQALIAMVDDLVKGYRTLATEATAARQVDIAREALEAARRIAALGAKYR
jgi:hypothetical protein